MTGYEACLILHGKKSGFFSKVALNDSTNLNFMAVFFMYVHPENCGKLTYVSESPGRIFTGMRGGL